MSTPQAQYWYSHKAILFISILPANYTSHVQIYDAQLRVNIRRTLLIAFLFVGLTPAIVLTYLAFVKARSTMQAEIEQSLTAQSAALSADIDKMLFERLQNAVIWGRLDVMQDIRVKDVDKRLSNFLAELKSGYSGVYRELICVSPDGSIVSASSAAVALGMHYQPKPFWLHANLPGGTLSLEEPQQSDHGPVTVAIHSPINSMFGNDKLGDLVLQFDWSQIYQLLDQAAANGRMLAVLDHDGRIVAASRTLRDRKLLMSTIPVGWLPKEGSNAAAIRSGWPLPDAALLVGYDRSRGYQHFPGFGWSTIVMQPLAEALAPVNRMAMVFLSLLVVTIIITIGIATWVARAIARPIVALTAFTRRFMTEKILPPTPRQGTGEVGELTRTFVEMVKNIENSRQYLVRASKLAVIGEMAAVIAHEVRTPLGILRSSAQMLRREPGLSDEGRELMAFIESETERLNRLVSAMLDSARPRAPLYQPTDMHELISKSIALLSAQADKKHVSITKQLAAGACLVECDAEQMMQVMLNLLLNGLQILQNGGRIAVSTADDAQRLVIRIADDGPGIAPEDRAQVFEAFFFKREGGIGLGLAIVQQIVASHGGEVQATESDMGGALFTIWLPRKIGKAS